MKKLLSVICFVFLTQSSLFSQSSYYLHDYTVYHESQSFYFKPSGFSLSQQDVLKEIQHSFSSHFLSGINFNPAHLNNMQDDNYFYVDIRTAQKKSISYYNIIDYTNLNSAALFVPPQIQYQEREPLFSIAFFTRPLKNNKRFKTGITYQHININDSFYPNQYNQYPYTGIILHNLNSDQFTPQIGNNFSDDVNYSKYRGHFISLYNSYSVSNKVDIGVKLALSTFNNNGNNIPENIALEPGYISRGNYGRNQEYQHLDISTGVFIAPSNLSSVSLTLGFQNGTFEHNENGVSSNSQKESWENGEYFLGQGNSTSRSLFLRDGNTLYSNIKYLLNITTVSSIQLTYRTVRNGQDLRFGNLSEFNSSYYSRYFINPNEGLRIVGSDNLSLNESDGGGNSTLWNHDFSLRYDYDVSSRLKLITGIQFSVDTENEHTKKLIESTSTGEDIITFENNEGDTNHRFYSFQSQNVSTHYTEQQISTYIPIMLNIQVFKKLSVEIGAIHLNSNFKAENQQTFNIYEESLDVVDGTVNTDQYTNTYQSQNDQEISFDHWNTFGSIIFQPSNTFRFQVKGVSTDLHQGELLYYGTRSERSYNFSISAEISF